MWKRLLVVYSSLGSHVVYGDGRSLNRWIFAGRIGIRLARRRNQRGEK